MNTLGACVAHLISSHLLRLKAARHVQTCSTQNPDNELIAVCHCLQQGERDRQAHSGEPLSPLQAILAQAGPKQLIVCIGAVRGKVVSAESSGVVPCPRHLSAPSHLSPLQSHWTALYGPGLGPSYTINTAGGNSRPGCTTCVRPKQQKKTSLPPMKPTLSHGTPPTGRISARWNTDTTDIQTTPLHRMGTKLLLPPFAAALQGSDSLAQPRTPIHPWASEVRPFEVPYWGIILSSPIIQWHFRGAIFLTQREHDPTKTLLKMNEKWLLGIIHWNPAPWPISSISGSDKTCT